MWWWISGLVAYLGIVCVGGVGKAMFFYLGDGGDDCLLGLKAAQGVENDVNSFHVWFGIYVIKAHTAYIYVRVATYGPPTNPIGQ